MGVAKFGPWISHRVTHDRREEDGNRTFCGWSQLQTLPNPSPVQLLTLCDEEVEHGEDHRVTAEHVVAARVHSRQAHPETAPDGDGSLQLGPHVAVDLKEIKTD